MPSRMSGTATAASTLVNSEPGPRMIWSAAGQGGHGLDRGLGIGGHQGHRPDVVGGHHRHLAVDLAAVALGLEDHRLDGGRQHPAPDPEQPAGLVEGGHRIAGAVDEAGQDQVPERVAGQLLLAEAVLEGGGQQRARLGQRHQALAQVPGRDDLEELAEPARRAAVVGHRHDGRHLGRCSGGRPAGWRPGRGPRRWPPPVGPLTGRRPGGRRWWACRGRPRRRDSSSARTTERCRPPVQPMATVRYDFPSRM